MLPGTVLAQNTGVPSLMQLNGHHCTLCVTIEDNCRFTGGTLHYVDLLHHLYKAELCNVELVNFCEIACL